LKFFCAHTLLNKALYREAEEFMNTNVNLEAPLAALTLLGTGFLVLVAAVALVQSLIVRKTRRAKIVLRLMCGIVALYASALLLFSLASHYKLLARGEEKHFCELDCHLAYSVVNVSQSALPGHAADQLAPTIVTIKTRFDEKTIAPWRGNGLLYPNNRRLTLFDDLGNRYQTVSATGTPLTAPLRPGESYTTDVVFNLPAGAKPARLLMNEGDWITHFVIGHENSPLHKKTEFQL
jgi:hypothetical protein